MWHDSLYVVAFFKVPVWDNTKEMKVYCAFFFKDKVEV